MKLDYFKAEDDRHYLYKEYLRIIAEYWPANYWKWKNMM